jgi:hypothetical protein
MLIFREEKRLKGGQYAFQANCDRVIQVKREGGFTYLVVAIWISMGIESTFSF